jgi:hypothetical protein
VLDLGLGGSKVMGGIAGGLVDIRFLKKNIYLKRGLTGSFFLKYIFRKRDRKLNPFDTQY